MEKGLLCCVGLLIILGISKFQSGHCAHIDANLECTSSSDSSSENTSSTDSSSYSENTYSSDSYSYSESSFSTDFSSYSENTYSYDSCSGNGQISKMDEVLTIAASSCETCILKVNATRGHQICLEIESVSSWSQLDHFYFVYTNVITGFTEKSEKCSITFPTNAVEIGYKLDAIFVIHAQVMNQSERCSESDATTCNLSHNCNSLRNFHDLKYVTYREQETLFKSAAYSYFRLVYVTGWLHIIIELPPCPSACRCSLHYQRLVVYCDGETKQILLLHPELGFSGSKTSSASYTSSSTFYSSLNTYQNLPAVFDVSNQQLENVDANAFQDLSYIYRLILNENLLTRIPPGMFDWIGLLFFLELADNKLSDLAPDIFSRLLNLTVLDLHGNQLTSLHPDLFKSQQNLEAVDLSRNKLCKLLPETFNPLQQVENLILDQNNITSLHKDTFQGMQKLVWLLLNDNQLSSIEPGTFNGLEILRKLQLSGNQLTTIKSDVFVGAGRLSELIISKNNISNLPPDVFRHIPEVLKLNLEDNQFDEINLQPFTGLNWLLGLNISGNHLSFVGHGLSDQVRSSNASSLFPSLKVFLLNDNKIQDLDGNIFKEMPGIVSIQIRGNPLKRVDKKTFQPLENNTNVLVDEAATCCFIEKAQCKPQNPKEPYLTCLRLLPYPSVRVFMWTFGLFAFVGNLSVLLWRCIKHGKENIIQVLLVENLAASDFLMGVYMLIIASADVYYQQYFPSESDEWRNGPLCKLAGTLSVISSEASVFFITLISIDRFLACKYPRGKQRLTKKSARITLICLWSLALLLSIIPTSVSGKNPDFYDVSEVCIGLPFVRAPLFLNKSVVVTLDLEDLPVSDVSSDRNGVYDDDYLFPETGNKPGLYYSIVLFLGINSLCFLIVAVCYMFIFIIVKQSSKSVSKSRTDQEITLAVRMGAIVLTDFMCWSPIVLIGILVQSATVTISPVVYVYIVVFILPINSAVNPYIYTIGKIISDYRTRTRTKNSTNNASSNVNKPKTSNEESTSFTNQ